MLRRFPPMGVYETLFKFADACAKYMGDPGTHPWAQGYPLTSPVPDGPPMPGPITLAASDLMYPKATGEIELRTAIAGYYNTHYGASISPENVAVFAGGRPAIIAALAFLEADIQIVAEETEYTPYHDMLRLLGRKAHFIPSNPENGFRPAPSDYEIEPPEGGRQFLLKSNPCNPTGAMTGGASLQRLVERFAQPGRGALFDEAYEFFCEQEPESALRYIPDLNATDIFVIGAATKGLQAPGIRVGWAVAAERHIEIFRNYSSIGMGGVSRASQLYATALLEPARVEHARTAIGRFYTRQRARYREGLEALGFELYTGTGGFYHWGRLPDGLTAEAFNERLFEHDAGILPGRLCDMRREGDHAGRLEHYARFSFGPLSADSYEQDMDILTQCVQTNR